MTLSYTASEIGIALARRVQGTGDAGWTHVTWLNPLCDIVSDSPGAGDYDYKTILVIGANYDGSYYNIVADGRQTIVLGNMKK